MDPFEQLFAMLGLSEANDDATLDKKALELAEQGIEPEDLGLSSGSSQEVPGASQFKPLPQQRPQPAPAVGPPRASRPVDLITPFLNQMQQNQVAARQQAQPLFGAPLFGGQ